MSLRAFFLIHRLSLPEPSAHRRARWRAALLSGVWAVAVVAAGCVTHKPLSDDYSGPEPLPESLARQFSLASAPPVMEDERARVRLGLRMREMVMPSLDSPDRNMHVEVYDVAATEPVPVIVILPIFNGQLRISRYFARHFVNQGWAVVVVDRDRSELEDDILDPEDAISASIRDYMRVLDWVAADPAYDPDRVGIFGVSLGGMDAVMLAALDDRVNSVVAAMAGGDLTDVVMSTSYRSINRTIEHQLEVSGLSREAFRRELDENIRTEPVALAPYVNAEDVLLILTRGDWIVPFSAQEELLESLGNPESLVLPTGHRTSVVYFPLLRSTAFDFFRRRFAVEQN